ncbi:MAG: hypothetical protein H0V70_11730 [Ktedonobacteraceae bacterium]|nr:hypothetical protein [Ktedonobacteraceae bacterium]
MYNQQFSLSNGHNDHYERIIQQLETEYPQVGSLEEQRQIEQLISLGFEWEEAAKLCDLREYLYDNDEMRERVANDSRMHFARWLYQNGEIKED